MSSSGIGRIEVFDHNNDGWPDALLADRSGQSLCLLAGDGPRRFANVTREVGLTESYGSVVDFGIADLGLQ